MSKKDTGFQTNSRNKCLIILNDFNKKAPICQIGAQDILDQSITTYLL